MSDVLEGVGFLMCLCMSLGAFLFALGWGMARKTELRRLETQERGAYLETVLARRGKPVSCANCEPEAPPVKQPPDGGKRDE